MTSETKGGVSHEQGSSGQSGDTAVYPLIQMGPFGVVHDEEAMLCLLRSSKAQENILLASGYFNLTEHYMYVILNESLAKFSILMASPQVKKSISCYERKVIFSCFCRGMHS